jgi:hypothetical protein
MKVPRSPTIRAGAPADMPELARLFSAQQAKAGTLHEINIEKMNAAFERAIAKDGAMLVVAPGQGGRLNGFLLYGLEKPWYSDVSHRVELCLCVDGGHFRSRGARALRAFSVWVRSRAKKERAAVLPKEQACTAAAPPAAVPSGSDKIISAEKTISASDDIAQGNLGDAIGLLKTLATQSRQSNSVTA